MVDVPSVSDHWNHDSFFGQDFMRNLGMSRRRFQDILSALHLCDIEEDQENQRKKVRGQKYDPLIKLKPFMCELKEACLTVYSPGQNVSIDERMVKSKAGFSMKQYIKNKPTKWGSNFGYLLVLTQDLHVSSMCILEKN